MLHGDSCCGDPGVLLQPYDFRENNDFPLILTHVKEICVLSIFLLLF